MKKVCALIARIAALFAKETGFDTRAVDAPNGGGLVITEYNRKRRNAVIPATIGGKAVVGIGGYAFYGCSRLASVTIPAGV